MDDFFPPGYTETMRDRGNTTKRRETNTNNLLRRIMSSAVVGVGTLSAKAAHFLNDEDGDVPYLDDQFSESKYDGDGGTGRVDGKYDSVLRHTKLFRHSGYQIERRLSSHETLESRYKVS